MIKFDREVLDQLNINEEKSGKEHFRLLRFLASQFTNETFLVLGGNSRNGFEALSTPTNKVINENMLDASIRSKCEEIILSSAIIFMDTEPHEGKIEYNFYQYLVSKRYNGLFIVNHIWYYKEMRDNFWYLIPLEKKYDLTWYGHGYGTGLIECMPNRWNWTFEGHLLRHQMPPESKWTFITSYIDLTKCFDANSSMTKNDLKDANATMSIPFPLIVYCEKEHLEILRDKRPVHLRHLTEYREISFEDIPLVRDYRMKIIENRIKNPYQFDVNNTASYYLYCMMRYWVMILELENSSFGSTHYGWVDIFLEKMGYENLIYFNDVVSVNRDHFSACYIDYQPEYLVMNYREYYQYGRCSFCSNFFTASAFQMYQFCSQILKVFKEVLERGYGHGDEQLYSIIYFRNPGMIDFYLGDYGEMITNYRYVYKNVSQGIRLMERVYELKNMELSFRICEILLESVRKKCCFLGEKDLSKLIRYGLGVSIFSRDDEKVRRMVDYVRDLPEDIIMK